MGYQSADAGARMGSRLGAIARARELATAAFRRAFENFHRETAARQWADAFATQRAGEERLERMKPRG